MNWIPALDPKRVRPTGEWTPSRLRYAAVESLATFQEGAVLTCTFTGSGIALGLGDHAVPAYGAPNLGRLTVSVDGKAPRSLYPGDTPNEVVLFRNLPPGEHTVRVVHGIDNGVAGCRISGFRTLDLNSGDLSFTLNGEDNAFLVDVRARLDRDGVEIRNTLVRNWLTGGCCLAGLSPGEGYTLRLVASGWKTRVIDGIAIRPNRETVLPPIYLQRESTRPYKVRFPALGHPAVRRPGESFRVRFQGRDTAIDRVRLSRSAGPATISREPAFQEDPSAAYYYDREIAVTLPQDMSPGIYDLTIDTSGSPRAEQFISPQSLCVVSAYPHDPVLMTFGHLDTSGQYQAEYLSRLATLANLLAPDAVLISTACNPAYISGALQSLKMPYVINFGNHQFFGHQRWYGDPVDCIDFGASLCILNFSHPWHTDLSKLEALLSTRAKTRCKTINAFEPNAPLDFLDRHGIQLIHDAHGPGDRVMDLGKTPTRRVGKSNSSSFRLIRFKNNRIVSCTYRNDPVAPIPFDRESDPPLSVSFNPANNGAHTSVTATIANCLEEKYTNARLTFVLPGGTYHTDGGRIESTVESSDGQYSVLTVRVDLPAQTTFSVTVSPDA